MSASVSTRYLVASALVRKVHGAPISSPFPSGNRACHRPEGSLRIRPHCRRLPATLIASRRRSVGPLVVIARPPANGSDDLGHRAEERRRASPPNRTHTGPGLSTITLDGSERRDPRTGTTARSCSPRLSSAGCSGTQPTGAGPARGRLAHHSGRHRTRIARPRARDTADRAARRRKGRRTAPGRARSPRRRPRAMSRGPRPGGPGPAAGRSRPLRHRPRRRPGHQHTGPPVNNDDDDAEPVLDVAAVLEGALRRRDANT